MPCLITNKIAPTIIRAARDVQGNALALTNLLPLCLASNVAVALYGKRPKRLEQNCGAHRGSRLRFIDPEEE